jgi:hypothetical protein
VVIIGFAVPQGTLRNGARCSTAKAFLLPSKTRSNLHVIAFAFVTRVSDYYCILFFIIRQLQIEPTLRGMFSKFLTKN